MGSETIHANQESTAARRLDHDEHAPDGTGAADPELRSFTVIPPYPTGVRRYASGGDDELGGTEADAGVAGVLRRRKGAGKPLDRTDADRFGSGFGADLSGVRVHTDGEADTIARSVQSVAFTYGSDVYFSRGSFAPGTDSGDHLLAHELAHVVQGSSGRWAASGSGVQIGRADDPAEAAADAAADQVMTQLRHGGAPDPAAVGPLPAATGEPIARTVRRAGLKSLAKKIVKGKKKSKNAKTRPDSGRLGGASIADLKAASDAAHAARHQPSSSGSSSSSGPERKRRSSSRSSRSRHHDESKDSDVSGEGSESETEEKSVHYETDLRSLPPGFGYSLPGSLHHLGDSDSESSESEGEDAKDGGYQTFEQARAQFGGDSDSESSESEDEEKDAHYSTVLPGMGYSQPGSLHHLGDESSESEDEEKNHYSSVPPPGHHYSLPGNLHFLGDEDSDSLEDEGEEKDAGHYQTFEQAQAQFAHDSDSESDSSEEEGSEEGGEAKDAGHYSLPGNLHFLGESESGESESDDDDIFGVERGHGGDSESSEGEDEEKGGHYNRNLDLGLGRPGYSLPGNLHFLGEAESGESESDDDSFSELSSEEGSEEKSGDSSSEEEGSESEGEDQAPGEQKKRGHRAFLIRNLPASFADETKSGKAGMEVPIGQAVERLTRGNEALALLEGGGTVAAAIGAVRHQVLKQQLQAVGEDTDRAIAIVRAYVDDQREFLRRQDLPVDVQGKLGDISTRKVHYDSKEEQGKSLVTVSGGKLVRSGGEAVDTSKSSTFHTGNGAEIFVASETGELHMASHQIGKYHHSSLLAGDQVSVGGEMKVTGGKIDWISNKSGHYMPTQEHLVQFVHWLGKDGVDLKSVMIKDGFGFQGGMTADKFIAGVDEHGAEEKSMSFHALKLQALIALYEDEYGDEVDDFLEEKGWDVFDGVVLNARPGDTNAAKQVISDLKKKFGEPTGALEKV